MYLILIGLDDGHVELWERGGSGGCKATGEPKQRLSNLSGHIDVVKTVDMSPKW